MTVALLVAWLALIAAATLTPGVADDRPLPALCLWCGQYGTVDIVANLILFLPVGAGLRLLGVRATRALAACFALTVTIELLQHFVIPGRHGGIEDIVSNTAGGAIGIVLAAHWRAWFAPHPKAAARLTWASGALVLAILAGGTVLATPDLPGTKWWTVVTPDLPSYDRFDGAVRSVEVEGRAVTTASLPDTHGLQRAWSEGPIRVSATVGTGDSTGRLAPILAIFDDAGREILALGQQGNAVALRVRQHAATMKLRPVTLLLPGALARAGDSTDVHVEAEVARGEARLRATRGRRTDTASFALTPTLGWTWMVPATTAVRPGAWAMAALCIASLLFPVAYWGRRAGGLAAVTVAPLVAVAGLWLIPLASGLPHVDGRVAAAAAAAMVVGWLAGGRARRPARGTVAEPAPFAARRAALPLD